MANPIPNEIQIEDAMGYFFIIVIILCIYFSVFSFE